jgi:hypothetical protein
VDVLLVGVCGAPLKPRGKRRETIPIVVATCNDDLVETGAVKSMAHPGGNDWTVEIDTGARTEAAIAAKADLAFHHA